MKRVIVDLVIVGIIVCFLSGCTQRVDIETEKAEVISVLDQWIQALETEDVDLLSKIIAHDDDIIVFGTDADERVVGWERLRQLSIEMFESVDETDLTVRDRVIKVHRSGEVAWFSEINDYSMVSMGKSLKLSGLRFTGVLEKRSDNWIVVQWHVSVPVAGRAVEY